MDNPQQVLLHLTSRGSRVRTLEEGGVGRFTNMSTQPINNINKYGLLHYSIPKTLDLLDDTNRAFTMRIVFESDAYIDVPVILPDMDYYNMRLDNNTDDLGQPAFTEVLQTTINWAIQKYWTANRDKFNSVLFVVRGPKVCNRLGCIVKVTNDKRLQFIIGWRGTPKARQVPDDPTVDPPTYREVWRYYNNGDGDDEKQKIQENTGNPVPVAAENKIMEQNGFPGVIGNVGPNSKVLYHFIDTKGNVQIQDPDATDKDLENSQLKRVEFLGLSKRLQLMFGAPSSSVASGLGWLKGPWVNPQTGEQHPNADALFAQRGRMVLVNYKDFVREARTGLLDFTMSIPPNLFAPSFMFLQLTAQGTKSKVLGHDAERGGWAVPTASNNFTSKYDNFPGNNTAGMKYNVLDVRQCPALFNLSPFLRPQCKVFVNNHSSAAQYRFDQLPWNPESVCFTTGTGVEIRETDNYSLVTHNQFDHTGDPNVLPASHKFGSRMIHYGDLERQVALAEKPPRGKEQFDVGSYARSPTFTVSMIDPNWIYTDVPNSTVQSLSILLMWGDTNSNVEEVSAYPVQFTMIASQ